MDQILAYPEQAYKYINGQYGTIGLIVAGLLITVSVIAIFIWNDRRK